MKSHIQIPKCAFAEFTDGDKKFYKYNVLTNKISKGYPRSTFTEENYFSEIMEKALSCQIETPLGRLLDFARKLPHEQGEVPFSEEIKNIAVNYAKSLMARSPNLFQLIHNESVFLQFFSLQDQHDMTVDYAMREEKMTEFFDGFDFSFMINKTQTPFILPTRGIYDYRINKIQCMNIPLNPYCAILLKEKGKAIHEANNPCEEIMIIPEGFDNVVHKINGFAVLRQKNDGIGYVVCADKKVLEELV